MKAETLPAASLPEKEQRAEEVKKEEKESVEPKSPLDSARESYVQAKLAFDSKKEEIAKLKNLTEEEREKHFEIDPKAKNILETFQSAETIYSGEREKDLGAKLKLIDKELADKKLGKEERSAELKKAASTHLMAEFKKAYDIKTEILAKENAPGALSLLKKVGDWYRSRPLKEKLLVAGALMAGGAAAGAVGGGVGLVLGTVVGLGGMTQRLLAGSSIFVGLEGFLQKKHKEILDKESAEEYQKFSAEVFEKSEAKNAKGLVEFLKLHDKDLENRFAAVSGSLKESEKRMGNRRVLISLAAGALIGSGALAEVLGLKAEAAEQAAKPEALVPAGASAEEVVKAADSLAQDKIVNTIEKGGSVSRAAMAMVGEGTGKIPMEEFKLAWNNSFVEIDGVKVPIRDVSLVHEGDQVVYVPGEGDTAGHFEVVDYVKDKLSLGTTEDLYQRYQEAHKEPPEWLEKAVAKNINEAFADNKLDTYEARNIESHFNRGSLKDKEEILEKLFGKMGDVGPDEGGKEFSDLFVKLSSSGARVASERVYQLHIKMIGIKPDQYEAIKDLKVGEFLEKRGRSWWRDYFFPHKLPYAGGQEERAGEIFSQRKLADYIRLLVSKDDKELTVEKFLKKLS